VSQTKVNFQSEDKLGAIILKKMVVVMSHSDMRKEECGLVGIFVVGFLKFVSC